MSGTWSGGKHACGDADAAIFSFQAVKNLPTADAGMICFEDRRLDEEVRKWAWMGINKDTYARSLSGGEYKRLYEVEHPGFKYHGNSIMATMALVSLRYLEKDNGFRRKVAARYGAMLRGATGIESVPVAPGCTSSRHLYQVLVDRRDEVMVALNRRAIYPGVHYRDNTLCGMYAHGDGTCPRARRASERIISLPLHLRLTEADVDRVAATVREVVQG